MIPKIIHYCWFGSKRKPKYFDKCLKSWLFFFPGFTFIEWNESNSDLTHPFLQEAIRQKKWVFISDLVRIQVLVEYGGIYLDTDMLFIKSFDRKLLEHKYFIGMENSKSLSAGILGCEKNCGFFKEVLNFYTSLDYFEFEKLLIPGVLNFVFLNYMKEEIRPLAVQGGLVLPCHVFYPLPFKLRSFHWNLFLYSDSLAVHLWAGSWTGIKRQFTLESALFFLKYHISKFYVPKSFLKYRDLLFQSN